MQVGAGLNNLGNTCFFNAALQPILHTKGMIRLLTGNRHSESCRNQNWCVLCELQRLFSATRSNRTYAPNSLIRKLPLVFKKFRLGRQEDSHQFLRYLVEAMQEAETGKLSKNQIQNQLTIKATNIFAIFGGIMKTSVECLTCSYRSITSERYYDLNIECQRSNSLQEGLNNFFAPDALEGTNKYYCERCKNRCNAVKRTHLGTVPQVLTFQFKRFTNLMRKINKFMHYPSTLNLGNFLDQPRKTLMQLYGIIVHAGGSSYSGHYYAYVRVEDKWFKMDDSYVSKCNAETALGQNAYLLFYEKVHEEKMNQEKPPVEVIAEQVTEFKEIKETKIPKKEKQVANDAQKVHEFSINKHLSVQKCSASLQKPKLNGHSKKEGRQRSKQSDWEMNAPEQESKLDVSLQNEIEDKDSESSLEAPAGLVRRKSKEEFERETPFVNLIWKYAQKMTYLTNKTEQRKPVNRSLRRRYDLRVYERKMLKKRNIF